MYNKDMQTTNQDPEDNCLNCNADRMEFRLVRGTSYEGLSIRGFYYDKNNELIGWDPLPLSPLAATKEEAIGFLVDMMKNMDDMFEAAKKPIISEAKLEQEFK